MTSFEYFLFYSRPLWGIDGPTWLVLMGAAFVVGIAVWLVVDIVEKSRARRAVREASSAPVGWAQQIAATMSPIYAAYLCGGRRRVTDLAFAELTLSGAVPQMQYSRRRITLAPEVKQGAGQWAPGIAGPSQGLSPVAVAMLESARRSGKLKKRSGRAAAREVAAVRAELVRGGLVKPARLLPHTVIALVAFAVFVLVNVVRAYIAASNYRPVSFMVFLLIVMIATVALVAASRTAPEVTDVELTDRGRQVRAALENEVSRLGDTVAMMPSRGQGLMIVAVGGLAATAIVPQVLVQSYSSMMWSSPFTGGDSSSSMSGCGGSSCGSGCGGGGCGGCGS